MAPKPATAGAAATLLKAHRQRDARGALRDVEHGHENARAHARRTQHVRGADIAAADAPKVGRPPSPREQQRERHGPDAVAHDDEAMS